jgi:hypothetical protein
MPETTTRTAILAALALLASLLAYGGLWYLLESKRVTVETRATQRASSSSRQLELATLKATLVDTAEDRARLREIIVADDRLTEFLALVEGGARAQGLVAETRSVDIVDPQGPFEELRVVLEADGSYDSLRDLILLFETMPFHIDMETIAFDRDQGATWHGVFTFRVTKERIR